MPVSCKAPEHVSCANCGFYRELEFKAVLPFDEKMRPPKQERREVPMLPVRRQCMVDGCTRMTAKPDGLCHKHGAQIGMVRKYLGLAKQVGAV